MEGLTTWIYNLVVGSPSPSGPPPVSTHVRVIGSRKTPQLRVFSDPPNDYEYISNIHTLLTLIKDAMHEDGFMHMSAARLQQEYPVFFWNLIYFHDGIEGQGEGSGFRDWADLNETLRMHGIDTSEIQ
jgi:hypothetical protein